MLYKVFYYYKLNIILFHLFLFCSVLFHFPFIISLTFCPVSDSLDLMYEFPGEESVKSFLMFGFY